MSPYDCPICGTKLKVNSPQVIGVHERGKVHQAALAKQGAETIENKQNVKIETKPKVIPVQKTVETIIPEQPKTQKLDINPEVPKLNVTDKKTEKDEEWGGFFGD